jgi:hypothetical protein
MFTVKPRTTHRTTGEVFESADLLESKLVLDNYRSSNWNLQWGSKEEGERIAFGNHRGALQLSPDYFQIVKKENENA